MALNRRLPERFLDINHSSAKFLKNVSYIIPQKSQTIIDIKAYLGFILTISNRSFKIPRFAAQ